MIFAYTLKINLILKMSIVICLLWWVTLMPTPSLQAVSILDLYSINLTTGRVPGLTWSMANFLDFVHLLCVKKRAGGFTCFHRWNTFNVNKILMTLSFNTFIVSVLLIIILSQCDRFLVQNINVRSVFLMKPEKYLVYSSIF